MEREAFHHDDSVGRLRALAADDALGERVTELFIASLATGARRAMTPLMAYHSARNLPEHAWEPFDFAAHNRLYREESEVPCAICGIARSELRSREGQLWDFAFAGRCSTVPCYSHLIDLEDVPNIALEYRPEQVEVLRALLELIDSVPADVSTTDLLKRVSSTKLLPKSNHAARLWCLRILAELGVISNAAIPGYSGALQFHSFLQRIEMEKAAFAHLSHRADPVWPLSAGRGTPAVDWSLARRLFPQLGA